MNALMEQMFMNLFPTVMTRLCPPCYDIIIEIEELNSTFCDTCTDLLIPCKAYMRSMDFTPHIDGRMIPKSNGWIKICKVCRKPVKLAGPCVPSLFTCYTCRSKIAFVNRVFRPYGNRRVHHN